ncbi:hypothetical protein, partial [Cellulosilyticum ruminicola]|uniref:hypothetical protein n=1 Tax=Cellulosilyticum ruminicola TaxID=425254 RepID=UPI001A9A604E
VFIRLIIRLSSTHFGDEPKEIKKISAYDTITELNSEILTQFINSITINQEGKPTINYRFTLPSNAI